MVEMKNVWKTNANGNDNIKVNKKPCCKTWLYCGKKTKTKQLMNPDHGKHLTYYVMILK